MSPEEKEKQNPVEEKDMPSRKDDPSTPPLHDPTGAPHKAPSDSEEPPKKGPAG